MIFPNADTVVLVLIGAIVGMFVLLMAAFSVVYAAVWAAAVLVRTVAGRPRAPVARHLPTRLRPARAVPARPAPSSVEHWTARSLS